MLAQRDDLFPETLVAELHKLQDRAGTFPAAVARRIVEDETGREVAPLFASFDDEPMAAASMAQVHRAVLPDGTRVIVKVQRPHIGQTVEADIAFLRRLVRMLSGLVPFLRPFNLPELVEEFSITLRGEFDFEREGHNAERFAEANREEALIFVPKVFWQATARRVLPGSGSTNRRDPSSRPASRGR